MKWKKYVMQSVAGLVLAMAVMIGRGLLRAESAAEVLMAVSDGFCVAGLLFSGFGALLWVSATGMFDIFGYAFRKCAHALIPGTIHDTVGRYYEYKMDKADKRRGKGTEWSVLLAGCAFLGIAVLLTWAWYGVAGL